MDLHRMPLLTARGLDPASAAARVERCAVGAQSREGAHGKCGGRRPMAEIRPEVVGLVKELHAQRMSLREISADLADRLCSRANASPFWIMLLLVWGRLDNGMIPFWQPEGVACFAKPLQGQGGQSSVIYADRGMRIAFVVCW
jgi:hypothetical protein